MKFSHLSKQADTTIDKYILFGKIRGRPNQRTKRDDRDEMHALGKNDGINVPQKIVSRVDLRPKKLARVRDSAFDRLFQTGTSRCA